MNGSPIMFLSGMDREALTLTLTILHLAKEVGLNKFNVDLEILTKKIKNEEKYIDIIHDINGSYVLCFGNIVGIHQVVKQLGTYENTRCIYIELKRNRQKSPKSLA